MADLVFATRGQAEALAAQEAVRRKALETKQEFDEAAKATGAWDASMMKLKSAAESALRSVSTEQEKILDKIAKIQEAQEKGLIPAEAAKDAEEAIQRLRQEWIELDEATLKAAEATKRAADETAKQEQANLRLKTAAEGALRSIQTEEERILEQIEEIEAAMAQGLVPPDEAEIGIQRLRTKLEEVRDELDETGQSSSKLESLLKKAFDPAEIAKFALGFVSVKAGLAQLRAEYEDLQTAIDKRIAAGLKPGEKGDQLSADAGAAAEAAQRAEERAREARMALAEAQQAAQQSGAVEDKKRRQKLSELDQQIADAQATLQQEQADYDKRRSRLQRDMDAAWADGRQPTQSQFDAMEDLDAKDPGASARKRIAELERERNDLLFQKSDVADPALKAAMGAALKADADAAAARQRAEDAARARDEFNASPEGQRADYLRRRKQILEEGAANISGSKSVEGLSSDEQELVDDILRQVGEGATKRAIQRILKQLDDGVVTEQDAAAQIRATAQGLRQPQAVPQQGMIGYQGPLTIAPTAEAIRDSQNLETIARALEEMKTRETGPFGEAL